MSVSVLFSGGIDSTWLLFHQLVYTKTPIRVFTMNKKPNEMMYHIFPLVKRIEEAAGRTVHSTTRLANAMYIRDAVDSIQKVYGGQVLTGCSPIYPDIEPTVYIPGDTPPVRGEALNDNHKRYLMLSQKHNVILRYVEWDVVEELLPYTRSCGISGVSRCGGCYFCMERTKGFALANGYLINGRLTDTDLVDPRSYQA